MPTLNWIGKDKVVNHDKDVPFHQLKKKYSYGAEDSGNMVIHGDNLPVLKSLLPEYAGKVDVCYLDPPYNTGNESWIYNDNVNDPTIRKWIGKVVGPEGEDLSRHDKWLCMMYPRLKLVRELLSESGVVFISIDDNEQSNLKQICDEIFGIRNFITAIPWQSRKSLQNDTDLSINHEYILVYAKHRREKDRRLKDSNKDRWFQIEEFAFRPQKIDSSKFSNPDHDPRGPWKADPFDAPAVRQNLTYEIVNPNTDKVFLPPKGRHWRMEKERYLENLENGRIVFGKTGKTKPQLKVFLSEQEEKGSVPNSWFEAVQYGTATEGTKEIQKIFGEKIFDTVKPTRLLKQLISLSSGKNSLVLDAFAGSGTTAHAVLQLNSEDGGNRRFIACEMGDFCENITVERIQKAIDGYSYKNRGKVVEVPGTGGGFSFCELGEPIRNLTSVNSDLSKEDLSRFITWTELGIAPQAFEDEPNKIADCYSNGYYLFWDKDDEDSTFGFKALETMKPGSAKNVVFAEKTIFDDDELEDMNIVFKKIPTDLRAS